MAHKIIRISWIASVTIILLAYLGVLSAWMQAVQAGQAGNSAYYDLLSRAFLKREFNLSEVPSPLLLKLPNPYDPVQNAGLKLHDISLYNGKYYLYWGPVPALLLAAFHLFSAQPVTDALVVCFFICGLLLANLAIILWMLRRIFSDLPGWFAVLSVFLAGLSNPIPWLLGRPDIYEAAIAGGQFFLLAGIYWAITGLEKPLPNIRRLFFAGLFWSLAIGTRVSLLLIVFFLFLLCGWLIYLNTASLAQRQTVWLDLAVFSSPLILMLGALGLYNYFRFGSFFELGVQYQLAGLNINMLYTHHLVTSISYLLPELYNFVLLPFGGMSKEYPYLILLRAVNPAYHGPSFPFEFMVGLLWGTPFVVFSAVWGGFTSLRAVRFWIESKGSAFAKLQELLAKKTIESWFPFLLGGASLAGLFPLSLLFFGTMRYQADFTPALILLSIYGLGIALRASSDKPRLRQVVVAGALFLGVFSVLLGVHLGMNSSHLQYCIYFSSLSCHN